MKIKKLSFLIPFLIFTLTGCHKAQLTQSDNGSQSLTGYIFIQDHTLYVDEVEIVTSENTEKIKELGLTESKDYPNGYYIYNPTHDSIIFELTDDTIYTFTDFNLVFIKEENGKRIYTTNKKEEFLEASYYQNTSLEEQQIPYFIDVSNGVVTHITEEFIYTQ